MTHRTPSADGLAERGVDRRKWLRFLVVGGAVTVVGGAVGLVRTGGYVLGSELRAKLLVLAPWQYVVVRAVARRMVAPDRQGDVPSPDDVGVAEFVDAYLVDMRPAVRRDFLRMLTFTEQLAPLGSGLLSRFSELSPTDQDRVLARLEASRIDQLRAGFQAMKSLIMMGYYRDPRTFRILQYAGPLIAPVEEIP